MYCPYAVTSDRFLSRVLELESIRSYERTLDLASLTPAFRVTDSPDYHPLGS